MGNGIAREEIATSYHKPTVGKEPVRQHPRTIKALLPLAPFALFGIVAVGVLGPVLYRRGFPFSFDMSFGPEMKVPEEAFGLGAEFGRRLPDFIWLSLVARVIPPEIASKGILLFGLVGSGAAGYWASRRLLGRAGLTTAGAVYAGLFYEVNPFVYQRMLAGHWHILLGYVFFPLLVVAAVNLFGNSVSDRTEDHGCYRVTGVAFGCLSAIALTSAALGLTSFAVSVMGLITVMLVAVVSRGPRKESDSGTEARESSSSARNLSKMSKRWWLVGGVVAVWALANATWIVPALIKSGKADDFSDLDWRAFLVRGNDQWDAFLNVVRLVGFYREDFAPPSLSRPAGWLAFAAVLALYIAGLVTLYRRNHRMFTISLILPALFSILALGERAPIVGPVLGWVYPRTPGWQMFRETQKLLVPVCFFYAAAGGLGVSTLWGFWERRFLGVEGSGRTSNPRGSETDGIHGAERGGKRFVPERIVVLAAILLLPVAVSPDIFWGLRGRLSVSPYPLGWYEAAAALPPGDGKLLVFPWHQHLPFDFTGGKTNVNPAQDFFPKDVIQSNRAEFPGFVLGVEDPIDSYVRDFIAMGSVITDTSLALAPLGVDSVVVLKVADWSSYEFLEGKSGLTKVVDNDDLRLYVVRDRGGRVTGFRPSFELGRVQTSALAATESPGLTSGICPDSSDRRSDRIFEEKPFVYRIPGPGCWVVPQPYEAGWRLGGLGAADPQSREATGPVWSGAAVGARVEKETKIVFVPAYFAIAGHLSTLGTLIFAGIALFVRRRRPKSSGVPRAGF